jgi:hypothetical protein
MSLVSLACEANSETVAPSTFISGLRVSWEKTESTNFDDRSPDGSEWTESGVAVGCRAGSNGITEDSPLDIVGTENVQ